MKTVKINVYSFKELSEDAKKFAIDDYRQNVDYAWHKENSQVLNEFESIFPITVKDWEYGYNNYINFSFTDNDEIAELTGHRLSTYLWNNYKRYLYKGKYFSTKFKNGSYKFRHSKVLFEENMLGGYYIGYEILKPIFDFMKKPNNRTEFKQLLYDCLQSWVYTCSNDVEDYYSDERIIENIIANDYDFTEDGEMF